ncbi:MAG: hypothetical protein ACYDG2_23855, partial [Ruminiclostridium sp.]
TVNNRSIIDTLNTGKNSSLVLNNSGQITNVKIGENGTAEINNYNYIKKITGGAITDDSKKGKIGMNIVNSGYIGEIHTGAYSENKIGNDAFIGWVDTGLHNSTDMSGSGYTAYASGKGNINYNINGVKVSADIYNKAKTEAQKKIEEILAQKHYGFWHGGGYFLVEDSYPNWLYNDLKTEVQRYKILSSALEDGYIAATIYEAYNTAREQYGPMPPLYTLAATAYISIFDFAGLDDGTPSYGTSDAIEDLQGWVNEFKSVAASLAKFNYVMNSDYKYLMLGFEGRGEFKEQLNKLEGNMNKSDYNIFKSSQDNEAYKTAIISYVDKIYNMNENFTTNNAILKNILKNVANNVSQIDAVTINNMLSK